MEFSPEPDEEDLRTAFTKPRLETIESFDETNFDDTESLGHRDSSAFMPNSFQDSGSSISDGDDN